MDIKKKVLIVDDEQVFRDLLKSNFESANFEVTVAENGDDALRTALTEKPDAIVLDLAMPQTGGMQFLETLRQDDWGKNAFVLILTGTGDDEKVAQAMSLGARFFLTKADTEPKYVVERTTHMLSELA